MSGAGDIRSGGEVRGAKEGQLSVKDEVAQIKRERRVLQAMRTACAKTRLWGGGGQGHGERAGGRQKVSVAGVPRAVRTAVSWAGGWQGLAIQGSGVYPEA